MGNGAETMRTGKECAVGLRTLHPLAVFVAAATLLAAAGHCRAEGPSGLPDGSDATPASETVADPSISRDNAVAQDNTASSSPVPAADVTEDPAAGGDAGDEEGLREPSFGDESLPVVAADPIEPVNRGIFYVNDKLYRWVFKPVAKGYRYAVPEGARIAVRNFFSNLGTPIRVVNTLLQGKLVATGTELARFGINSTIGMAGLFDAAKQFDLYRKDEDAGQTLGVYGLGHGMYVVLPFLGPSSARDAVGFVGDTFLDPLSYLPTVEVAIGARVVRSETELSFRYEEYDELTGAAVDPYIAVRDAYLQYREKRVKE
jgi:phospholipid-binding lipoprotein MlaA